MATTVIAMLFMLLTLASSVSSQASKCTVDADVGIILDSSGSIRPFYRQEKDFVNSIAASFGIGSGKSRASVITFSFFSELTIKFSDYDDLDDFQKAVKRIPLMGRTTYMDKALRLAQREMFKVKNGARPGKAKLLIMLTDGKQTRTSRYEDPAAVIKDVRKDGIQVIVVGMGTGVQLRRIIQMAGGEKYAFYARDFAKLATPAFLNDMKSRSCDAAQESLLMDVVVPCPDMNADYKGIDVKLDLNVPSWQKCGQACNANPACNFFTFVSDSGCCYHKSAKGDKSKASGLISGSQKCVR